MRVSTLAVPEGPIVHRIYADLGIVATVAAGLIRDADLRLSYAELYESSAWKPGFDQIVDLRSADLTEVTSNGLHSLSRMVARYAAGRVESFRTSVVAPDDLSYGLARLYGMTCIDSPEIVQVFRDAKEALNWLGVPGDLLG